jgi:cytochrome b6-f complex iron-sulfur subunit
MAGRERGLDGMASRRRFLQQGIATAVAFVAVGCTGRSKAHVRRTTTTTAPLDYFGGRIDAGTFEAVRASVTSSGSPAYIAAARAYVSPFPPELADKAREVYPAEVLPLLGAGVVVLYQRCTHLGCRVPLCASSQWFECPCHDAKFDRVGEYRSGVAPRGLDLMHATVTNGRLVIDTGTILPGVAIGTDTTRQRPAGPFCV